VRSEARAEVSATASGSAAEAAGDTHPRLVIGGTAYPLVRAVTRIGRGSDSDIRIDDPGASRNHCEIVMGDPIVVRDLKSTNGTMVAGERITEMALIDGTAISIGSTTLVYRNG
jgi:pSer/pThr/pTyr-binding forkhead associated (FHA) protein